MHCQTGISKSGFREADPILAEEHETTGSSQASALVSFITIEEVDVYTKAVFPGKYIQGYGSLSELPSLISLFGKKGLLLASPSAKKHGSSGTRDRLERPEYPG